MLDRGLEKRYLEGVVAEVAAEEGLFEVRHHLGGPDHHASDRHQLHAWGKRRGGEMVVSVCGCVWRGGRV